MRALSKEGIPVPEAMAALNKDAFIENTLSSRNFQRMYSKEQLDHCRAQIECPDNDKLVNEAVWLSQSLLLGHQGGHGRHCQRGSQDP